MVRKSKVTLREDGVQNYDLNEPKQGRFGYLKNILVVIAVAMVTLICEPFFEDIYLSARCESNSSVDVISNVAIVREWPRRTSEIAGYVESGKRHLIHDTEYDRYMNDCWARINVDGTSGWILTLLDKH